MRTILIALFSLCASCASSPDVEAYRLALWNFHYESDKENEYRIYDSISSHFVGDCEDFAFTLAQRIGGNVWHIILPDGGRHAALVKSGIVYDNRSRQPIEKSQYQGEFIYIMQP